MDKNRRPGKELKALDRIIGKQIGLIVRNLADKYRIPSLSPMEMWIIGHLYRNPDREFYQKDVEAEFHVSGSTVTRAVQNMEKLGLLERSTNSQDQRLKQIRLTPTAAALHERFHSDILVNVDERLMEGISGQDEEAFYRVIDRMKQNLISADGTILSCSQNETKDRKEKKQDD